MPSYQQHGGYRLDVSAVDEPELAIAIAEDVAAIADDDLHTHETVELALQELAVRSPVITLHLWATEEFGLRHDHQVTPRRTA